jgi:hypothetical protein
MRNECNCEIFEVFTPFMFRIDVFLLATLSSRVIDCRCFEGTYCLPLKGSRKPLNMPLTLQDEGSRCLRNVDSVTLLLNVTSKKPSIAVYVTQVARLHLHCVSTEVLLASAVAVMEEVSNGKTTSNRATRQSLSLTHVTRPSSPRQFFARLYGNLESSGPSATAAETTR